MKKKMAILAMFAMTCCGSSAPSGPSLTIYNQNFAVVRELISLNLIKGINDVSFSGVTAQLEPDSVVLRDPSGNKPILILEQNYRSEPISEALLLSYYEGKTIEFSTDSGIITGKIIKSGHVPIGRPRQGGGYYNYAKSPGFPSESSNLPLVEVDGKFRFGLPGAPIFPSLPDDVLLKPTLQWLLVSDKAGAIDAELSYVSSGMSWEADYNLVSEQRSDLMDLVGWVTIQNWSGKEFKDANIKLMAGDVSKLQKRDEVMEYKSHVISGDDNTFQVTEKEFDDYHLYTLPRLVTLHDSEMKQVEFIRVSGIKSKRFYVYNGVDLSHDSIYGLDRRNDKSYGAKSNTKVWAMREFNNSKENHLGLPLPKGKMRFYIRDDDGSLQFVGENEIDHSPKDELVRVYTGNAFDIVGERTQTNFRGGGRPADWVEEQFEIKVKNHKKEKVEVRVVEHLSRCFNWEIKNNSHPYLKTDVQNIEFRLQIKPEDEQKITYTARYTW
ncbi:MAG TPA: DUF4139 domain-containing protein [bacterium]|nr:DUF4139 domain-containing protein [bacterium]